MAVSKRLRFEVLRRDQHTCRYCGRSAPEVRLTVDHVVPEALGGSDKPENLAAACSDCNSGKSATPPDAAQVEQVQDDALRWSAAVRAVAQDMVADVERRDQIRGRFEAGWQAWTFGVRHAPLPGGWRDTVDTFAAVGLPMPVLLECVDIAMGRGKVQLESKFRYMCGIAWKRVSELQEAALQRVRPPTPQDAVRQGNGDEVISDLFGALPWCDELDEWPALIADFEERVQDDEHPDGSPRTYEHWSDFEKVFSQSVMRVEEMRIQLVMWARSAFKGLPPDVVDRLRADVARLHAELGEPLSGYFTSDYLTAYAVMVAYFDKKGPDA